MPKTIDMLATIAMLTVRSLHFWLFVANAIYPFAGYQLTEAVLQIN